MEPEFRTGDAIAIRRVDGAAAAGLPAGTVVTFRASGGNGALITHRIIGSRISAGGQRVYTTKGDANADADTADLVPARIVGVLDYSVPRLGYVLNAMRQRSVTLPLAASALLASLAVSAWPRGARAQEIPNKKENT
jgi:signal peptidase I